MERNKRKNKKRFLVSFLVILTILLFFYFLYINFPKLKRAVYYHKQLSRIPPAVNLSLLKENTTLFRKSFAWNRQEMYISGYFNISDYLDEEPLIFQVNDKQIAAFMLFRFRNFSAVSMNKYVFVFPDSTFSIKEIAELEKYISSLFKVLVIKTIGNETVKIYSAYETSRIKIKNSSGNKSLKKIHLPLPVRFKKNRLYELAFEYIIFGSAIPSISMNFNSKEGEAAYWSYLLFRPPKGGFRKASILFSPERDIDFPNLILSNKKRKGAAYYKRIVIYKYAKRYPFSSYLAAPKIVYDDFYLELADGFIYKKYYNVKD